MPLNVKELIKKFEQEERAALTAIGAAIDELASAKDSCSRDVLGAYDAWIANREIDDVLHLNFKQEIKIVGKIISTLSAAYRCEEEAEARWIDAKRVLDVVRGRISLLRLIALNASDLNKGVDAVTANCELRKELLDWSTKQKARYGVSTKEDLLVDLQIYSTGAQIVYADNGISIIPDCVSLIKENHRAALYSTNSSYGADWIWVKERKEWAPAVPVLMYIFFNHR